MEKILPVQYPTITSYPRHAYILSILEAQQGVKPWIYMNFFELKCYASEEDKGIFTDWFDFDCYQLMNDVNPYLEREIIYRNNLLKLADQPAEWLQSLLQEETYLFTFLDEYYISGLGPFNKYHNSHANLIYGYDSSREIFHMASFSASGKFVFHEADYNSVTDAFKFMDVGQDYAKYNFLLKKREPEHVYTYDLSMFQQLLKDYLFSTKSKSLSYDLYRLGAWGTGESSSYVYGLKVYRELKTYLYGLTDQQAAIDIRPFHVLYEHKLCLRDHVKYLNEVQRVPVPPQLFSEVDELERYAVLIRNSVLKYSIKKDNRILFSVIDLLQKLSNLEKLVLESLIISIEASG